MAHTAAQLAKVISGYRYRFINEKDLQRQIEVVLKMAGIENEREVDLKGPDGEALGDIDFMVGDVGIEVKIKGGLSEVTRQLHRYAQSDRVKELLLVSSKMQLDNQPGEMNKKRVEVLVLMGSMF